MRSDFPGGPVIKTLRFQCKGHGSDPQLGNENTTCCVAWPKINFFKKELVGCGGGGGGAGEGESCIH